MTISGINNKFLFGALGLGAWLINPWLVVGGAAVTAIAVTCLKRSSNKNHPSQLDITKIEPVSSQDGIKIKEWNMKDHLITIASSNGQIQCEVSHTQTKNKIWSGIIERPQEYDFDFFLEYLKCCYPNLQADFSPQFIPPKKLKTWRLENEITVTLFQSGSELHCLIKYHKFNQVKGKILIEPEITPDNLSFFLNLFAPTVDMDGKLSFNPSFSEEYQWNLDRGEKARIIRNATTVMLNILKPGSKIGKIINLDQSDLFTDKISKRFSEEDSKDTTQNFIDYLKNFSLKIMDGDFQLERVKYSSYFDSTKELNGCKWAVTLIDSSGGLVGHSKIIMEGVVEGAYFMRYADLNPDKEISGQTTAVVSSNAVDPGTLKCVTHSDVTSKDRRVVLKMFKEIMKEIEQQSKGNFPHYYQLVKDIPRKPIQNRTATAKSNHNCISWAAEKLALIDINVNTWVPRLTILGYPIENSETPRLGIPKTFTKIKFVPPKKKVLTAAADNRKDQKSN